jgi:hypothetical protein
VYPGFILAKGNQSDKYGCFSNMSDFDHAVVLAGAKIMELCALYKARLTGAVSGMTGELQIAARKHKTGLPS